MDKKKTFSEILKILKPYKGQLIIAQIVAIIISFVSLLDSFLLSYLIDSVLVSNTEVTLLTISIIMFLVGVLCVSLNGIKELLIQKNSYSMNIDLMLKFYEKVLNLPLYVLEKHKSGELVARLNDARKVQNALSYGLISILTNLISFFIVGIALIKLNKTMFFISCIFIFTLGFVSIIFGKYYKRQFPVNLENYSDLQAFTSESFAGIETIKTMPASSAFYNEYKKRQYKTMRINRNIDEKCVLQNSLITILSRASSILVLIFGFYFVMKEKNSLGQIAAFLSLNGFFSSSVNSLINLQAKIQESLAAFDRLYEILAKENFENEGKEKPENIRPEILFEKINFSYSNEKLIYEKFELKISRGEWISFIGKTGCGKTTLTKLLLKFYKPQKGRILWNDIDLQNIDTEWLFSKIGYIPQDIILFAGTISENITLFNDAYKKGQIEEVAKLVGIYDKIVSLPNGFDTLVGEKGTSLSGGEKQKIAIARALLKKPLLLIFDEATSNLDVFSEKQIVEVIKKIHENGMTIITITHRLSTIRDSDCIIVLEDGKIIEKGKHEDLLKKNGRYKEMIV